MAFTKYLISALAVAGSAFAQTGCKGTATVQNSGDALALGSCTTYQGDIVIASQAAGSIALDGIRRITGSLSVVNAVNLTSLSGSDLQEIDKEMKLQGLTIMSSLNFPSLTKISTINWVALPALQQLSFTDGVQQADDITISNTQLNTLDGINLENCDSIDINNNLYLKEINMQLANVTQALNINANSKDLVASFPNLEFAFNMTFRNCSEVDLPSLSFVNGSIGFYSNYFKTFSAANLTQTGQSLVFDDNPNLTNISLPVLKQVSGGCQIANNTNLKSISGLPKLATVGGAIDFSGNFTKVNLPALQDVRGGFNLQTSGQFDCSPFDKAESSNVIKGKYVCAGTVAKPSTAGSTPTSTGSSSSSTSSSKSGGAGHGFEVNAPVLMGLTSVVAGFLHLVL